MRRGVDGLYCRPRVGLSGVYRPSKWQTIQRNYSRVYRLSKRQTIQRNYSRVYTLNWQKIRRSEGEAYRLSKKKLPQQRVQAVQRADDMAEPQQGLHAVQKADGTMERQQGVQAVVKALNIATTTSGGCNDHIRRAFIADGSPRQGVRRPAISTAERSRDDVKYFSGAVYR